MRKLNNSGLLLLLLVLAACSNLLAPADSGWVSHTPCTPSYWQNLMPGISTQADVEQFIKGLQKSEQETLEVYTLIPGRRSYSWRSAAHDREVETMHIVDDQVTLMGVRPLECDLRLGPVVDQLGPPELLYAKEGCFGHGGCYSLEVLYLQQGLAFESRPGIQNLGEIRPDMLVSAVYYFEPGSLENYWLKGRGMSAENLALDMRYIQPWSGFGEIVVPTEVHDQ